MRRAWPVLFALVGSPLWAAPPTLAQRIDEHLAQGFGTTKPVGQASDAEFLRRVYLDTVGRIPNVAETQAFLDDHATDKRAKLVEQLLTSSGYTKYTAQSLRAFLVPQASANPRLQHLAVSLETWLREELKAGKRYDGVVRDLLTTPLLYQERVADGPAAPSTTVTPIGFYQAGDLKTETVTANVARMFMGLRLECAQCHNHPFDKWTQQQFWETAAFFVAVTPNETDATKPEMMAGIARQLKIPDSNQTATAKLLDGKPIKWTAKTEPRTVFANWLTSKENPYFARMAVNRLWANYFGVGLVDPVDDFGPHNAPSHPELLDELTRAYVAADFDDRVIIRAITRTAAYQRTSKSDSLTQNEPRHYLRMNVKALAPEQLFDSLAQAGGYRESVPLAAQAAYGWDAKTPRGQFIAKFGGGNSRSDMQTSILQALALMNGDWVAELTDPKKGNTLKGLLEAPFLSDTDRLETLFLATLSRRPTTLEIDRFAALLKKTPNRGQAFADMLWALLNSNEFLVNH